MSFDDSDLDPDYRLTSEKTEKPSTDDETPQASSARRKGSKLLQRKAIKSARVAGVSYTNTSNKKSEKKYFWELKTAEINASNWFQRNFKNTCLTPTGQWTLTQSKSSIWVT